MSRWVRWAPSVTERARFDMLWTKQRALCAVTGLGMMYPGCHRHPATACLTWVPRYQADIGSVQPVLCAYFVNMLLRSFRLHEVLCIVQQASKHARSLVHQPAQALSEQDAKVPSLYIPQDILRQLGKALNNSLRRAVSRQKLRHMQDRHTLTLQQVKDMWIRQRGLCAISGVPMTACKGSTVRADMLSLDRIDSSLGYTQANTQLCTVASNLCTSDCSQPDFMAMLASIHMDC